MACLGFSRSLLRSSSVSTALLACCASRMSPSAPGSLETGQPLAGTSVSAEVSVEAVRVLVTRSRRRETGRALHLTRKKSTSRVDTRMPGVTIYGVGAWRDRREAVWWLDLARQASTLSVDARMVDIAISGLFADRDRSQTRRELRLTAQSTAPLACARMPFVAIAVLFADRHR